jgi:hypothetical protein
MLSSGVSGRMDIAAGSRADRAKLAPRPIMSATSRAKVSNGTRLLAGVDGRSATFRRFRDLVADLIREQGRELSISEIGLIRSAAALLVRSEELQAAAVRNEDLDGDELIRLTSEARRLLQLLRRSALPEPEPLTLEQHLRAVEAEEARRKREPAGRSRTVPRQRNATGDRGRPRRRTSCDDEEG